MNIKQIEETFSENKKIEILEGSKYGDTEYLVSNENELRDCLFEIIKNRQKYYELEEVPEKSNITVEEISKLRDKGIRDHAINELKKNQEAIKQAEDHNRKILELNEACVAGNWKVTLRFLKDRTNDEYEEFGIGLHSEEIYRAKPWKSFSIL